MMNLVNAPWKASTAYTVGQEILSSALHIETVVTAGTSGATPPTWSLAAGVEVGDGGVMWIDQGVLRAFTIASWQPGHLYTSTSSRILDGNGNIQVSTTPGTSGLSTPTWSSTPGSTTADGPVVWTNAGPVATFALPAAGGTSGIISDNVVAPTLLGASQVYFTTLGNQTCATDLGFGGCAVQASQPALQ